MTIKIDYSEVNREAFKKGKHDIYAVIEYNMYDEMCPEFNKEDYKVKEERKLDAIKFDFGQNEVNYIYNAKFEYPYGDIKIDLMYDTRMNKDELDLKAWPEEEKWTWTKDPEPISLAKLRQYHADEEEENKRRETEARMAQKRLEEEKARLRYEQQQ